MNNPKIVKSKVVCRKCKSKDIMLVEVWSHHTISWEQINGEFDRDDGALEMGDPTHVEAQCIKCKNRWRLRGISQIDFVIPD